MKLITTIGEREKHEVRVKFRRGMGGKK